VVDRRDLRQRQPPAMAPRERRVSTERQANRQAIGSLGTAPRRCQGLAKFVIRGKTEGSGLHLTGDFAPHFLQRKSSAGSTDRPRCRSLRPLHCAAGWQRGDTLAPLCLGTGMTAKYSRHVALTGPLARYVEDQVATGVYASASEVVRAGLRLLIERDEARRVNSRKAPRGTPRARF
jgi:antitoxin ParD1/3/4